jgi:ubiquinone biosynthesis protein
MQKKSLIPTPLNPHKTRKAIEIVEPSASTQHRFTRIIWFVLRLAGGAFAVRLWPSWARSRFSPARRARHVRLFMEQMGGLWVKIGQILALRRDVFSKLFCDELTRLQNRAHGFPVRYVRSIIEEELGTSIDAIFSEFEDQPLAAASVGQAHRARLRDKGVEVVVKVQRPNVRASFEGDFFFVRLFVKFLELIRFLPHFRWSEMYTELESAMLEELDYRQEATSLRRMRKSLRAHKIYVPKVYPRFCTDRVLVMEMVGGVYMSEYIEVATSDPDRLQAWRKENKIRAYSAGKKLLLSYLRQLFEDNLYHSDLHPGNILLMRKSRITLIDFGSVGTMDKTLLEKYLLLYKALGERDFHKVVEMFLLLCPSLPNKDLTDAKESIIRLYRAFDSVSKIKTLPYHEKSFNQLSGDMSNVLASQGVSFPWDFLRVSRAGTTLDASLMFLMPEINFMKVTRQYVSSARERAQKKPRDPKVVRAQLANLSERAGMVTKLAENAYFQGEYVRQRALSFEGYISKAANLGTAIFLIMSRAALLAAMGLSIGYVHQRFDGLRLLRGTWVYDQLERIPRLESAVWLFWIFVAVYLVNEFVQMKNVFKEPEVSSAGGDRR